MTRADRERQRDDLRGRGALLHGREHCTVLGVERHSQGRAVVLRRSEDGAELRAYWHEVVMLPHAGRVLAGRALAETTRRAA